MIITKILFDELVSKIDHFDIYLFFDSLVISQIAFDGWYLISNLDGIDEENKRITTSLHLMKSENSAHIIVLYGATSYFAKTVKFPTSHIVIDIQDIEKLIDVYNRVSDLKVFL